MSYTRVDQLLMYDLHYGIYTEPWNWGVSFRLNMPTFSKFIDGQRGSQQMWDVSSCYFHLCQAVQKNIQKKFKVLYFSDKKFARAARLVVFLAFVPIADVEDVFYEITYYIQSNYPQLMVVVNYFENTYLGLLGVLPSYS